MPWEKNDYEPYHGRRAVCRRCHQAMGDIEPGSPMGEFFHPSQFNDEKPNPCRNAGKTFSLKDYKEVAPFRRKKFRRQDTRSRKQFAKSR